jgi:hypothetical protein
VCKGLCERALRPWEEMKEASVQNTENKGHLNRGLVGFLEN